MFGRQLVEPFIPNEWEWIPLDTFNCLTFLRNTDAVLASIQSLNAIREVDAG